MGSKVGILKIAAKKIGVSFEDYLKNIEAELKWCTKCKTWKPLNVFSQDASRGSGKKSICKECDYQRKTTGPTKAERRNRATVGLAWCSHCQNWLPLNEVSRGVCKLCKRKYDRARYATDPVYRAERRQHAHSRKRNVDPIPVDGQQFILDNFNGKCAYCGNPAQTWDHIIPISKGGKTTPGNVVPACSICNSSKHDKDAHEWVTSKGIIQSDEFFNTLVLAECGLYG